MQLDKHYDVIVIGSNLSAYIAATLSAKKGLDTLLVDTEKTQYTYYCSGFQFDFVPQYSAGFYPEKLFDKIFQELNLSINEQKDIRKISATYQVIMPKFRVNITDRFDIFKKEITREFPNHSEKILLFYETIKKYYSIMDSLLEKELMLPPTTFKEKRLYKRILSSQGFSELTRFKTLEQLLDHFSLKGTGFETFVKAQICLFSYTYSPNPSFIQTVRILGNMMKRSCYIDGGYPKLVYLLKNKLLQFGGEIKSDVYIEDLIYQKNKLKGIRLSSYEGIVYSDYIISSLDINKFITLIGSKISRRYHMKSKSLLKYYSLFTVNVGLDSSVIPVGMKDRFVYVVNDKKPLVKENLILCNISHPKDNIRAPEGKRVLSASCIVPHRMIKQSDVELIKIKDRIIFNLKKIIPFLEDHVVTVLPRDSKHFKHLNAPPPEYNPPLIKPIYIYEKIGKPFLGISAIPNRTQENNLFFTGREVMPDIGFEGEMHSCYKVINHIDNEIKVQQARYKR